MLVGALAMIGLAMSGTLQMSRLPVTQVVTKWPAGFWRVGCFARTADPHGPEATEGLLENTHL
jgi:hypothetical protein